MSADRPYAASSTATQNTSWAWPALSALLLGVVVTLFFVGRPTPTTVQPAPAATAPAASEPPTQQSARPPAAPASNDCEVTTAAVNRAHLDVAEAHALRDQAVAEMERYKDGLERAVAQLNEQSAQLRRAPSYTPPAPRASSYQGQADPRVYSNRLQVLGDRITVTAEIRNIGSAPGGVRRVRISLLENGRPIDSQTMNVDVGQGTDVPVEAVFYRSAIDGSTYSSRVDVE